MTPYQSLDLWQQTPWVYGWAEIKTQKKELKTETPTPSAARFIGPR